MEMPLKQGWQDTDVLSVSPTETIAAVQRKEYVKLEWAGRLRGGWGGLAHSNHCTVVSLVSYYFQFYYYPFLLCLP
jgi:hypothetical protein